MTERSASPATPPAGVPARPGGAGRAGKRGGGASGAPAPRGRRARPGRRSRPKERHRQGQRARPILGAAHRRRAPGERPHDGVLGEEGSERTGTSGLRWVIDPLDGTTNYLYEHPGWTCRSPRRTPRGSSPGSWSTGCRARCSRRPEAAGPYRDGVRPDVLPPALSGPRLVGNRLRLRPGAAAGPGRCRGGAAAVRPRHTAHGRGGDRPLLGGCGRRTRTSSGACPGGISRPGPRRRGGGRGRDLPGRGPMTAGSVVAAGPALAARCVTCCSLLVHKIVP